MSRSLFNLGERLSVCASFVRKGAKIVDVGTDHAYLPIWLVKMGVANRAVAADIRNGPLEAAKKNIIKYNVGGSISTCLSDGLKNIKPEEVDDIVIAGMGGELILDIVNGAEWLRDENKNLILQPMSMDEKLRTGLVESGFSIVSEVAVVEKEKPYCVMCVKFKGEREIPSPSFSLMGKIEPSVQAVRYALKVIHRLEGQIKGCKKNSGQYAQTASMIEEIRQKYVKED